MGYRSGLAAGAATLWLAAAAWPQAAVARDGKPFEQLRATGGRFEIIAGAGAARPSPATPPPPRAIPPSAVVEPAVVEPAIVEPAAMKPDAPLLREALPTPAPSPTLPEESAAEPVAPLAEALGLISATLPPDPVTTGAVPPRPPVSNAVAPVIDDNMKVAGSGNVLMSEALRRARTSLQDFLAKAAAPPEGTSGFSVKVLVGPKEAREALWLSALERRVERNLLFGTSERWSGRLTNAPTESNMLRVGDRISFEASEIRDWTYAAVGGRPVGNFTACALTAPEGRAKLAELTEKTGLDCGWVGLAAQSAAR
jgi:uncharacterized protein YegJ (DUF2314 family)